MKNKCFKRILSLALSLLLVVGALPMAAFAAEEDSSGKPENSDWEGFDEFSSEVSELLSETMEDNYISAVTLEVGSAEMMVDGEEQSVVEGRNVTPITKDDVIMLPVRALAERENAAVMYDSRTSTATVQTNNGEIAFTRGKAAAAFDDGETEEETFTPLSTEPELVDGTMYVPLDTMADFLGYDTQVIEGKTLLTKPYQTKRLIVKSAEDALETYGAVREISGFQDLHVLQYETEEDAKEAHEKLMLTDRVEYVEPDTVVSTAESHKSWGTDYIGADTYNAYLQESTDLEEVVVAVVDTGVDSEHDFLKDRIIPVNKNFVDSQLNSNDKNGHGTHVAGIVTDATLPNVKILPVKVMGDDGKGSTLSVYNGAMFAIKQNCNVINMSLGMIGKSELNEEVVKAAVAENIAVVAAAGNEKVDARVCSPAAIPEAITVGALEKNGAYASYSNYGAAVDIWAPGSNIESSIPGGGFASKNGTSMAAPCAAAAAAMLKTYKKDLSPRQIEKILQTYASNIAIGEPGNSKTSKVLSVKKLETLCPEDIQEVVESPVLDVAPGDYYQDRLEIHVQCDTPDAIIRYTTDGTIPTENTGTMYTGSILLQSSALLRVKAFRKGWIESYETGGNYFVSQFPESFHYQDITYYDIWTYTCPDRNAKCLKVTFSGNTYIPLPQNGESTYVDALFNENGLYLYDGGSKAINNEYAEIDRDFYVYDELTNRSVIIPGTKFKILFNMPCTKSDYGFKVENVEPLYEERLTAPTFVTPTGISYPPETKFQAGAFLTSGTTIHNDEVMDVELSSKEGADIYYTLDGSIPTKDSFRYTGPIHLTDPKKIRAKAYKEGYVESAVASEIYYASKYPESLHYMRRSDLFFYRWKVQAPENVKYMKITFDENTDVTAQVMNSVGYLSFYLQHGNSLDYVFFHNDDLAGESLFIRGNSFWISWMPFFLTGVDPIYGFKVTDIEYFYDDDLIPIESIKIKQSPRVTVGETVQLEAEASPANQNVGVLWAKTRNHIAIEQDGTATGISKGQETITAFSRLLNDFCKDSAEITVFDAPAMGTVSYSTEAPTNQNVTATIQPKGSARVVNNGGKNTYTFTENGEFAFELEDETGRTGTVVAKVSWIDRESPTAALTYSTRSATNGDVLVTMEPSEDVTVTNTAYNSRSIRMTENGPVRFEFADKAGNTGFVEEEVTWIDKTDISAEFVYEDLLEGKTKVTLVTSKPVVVTNNNGSTEHVFTENGIFTFRFQYDNGKNGVATACVCWLDNGITYLPRTKTTSSVSATIALPPDVVVTNNQGKDTYRFEENGTFTFTYQGFEGHIGSATASVTWIERIVDRIHIESVEDLADFASQVDNGNSFQNTEVLLEKDLDMSGLDWTPIGSSGTTFRGVFNGQGHTLQNLHINPNSSDKAGLFNILGSPGIVKNLALRGISATGALCGGIACTLYRGTIENCSVTGEFLGENGKRFSCGGIVGENMVGTISNCDFNGTMKTATPYNGSAAGGIAGKNRGGQIFGCSAISDIQSASGNIGGIVGESGSVGEDKGRIEKCYSAGTLSGSSSIGGIVGIVSGATNITECYSINEIKNVPTASADLTALGGIAANIAVEGAKIQNGIALNNHLSGPTNHAGRVVGSIQNDTILSSNYAFSGMLMGPAGSEASVEDDPDSPLRHFNGKGASKEEIRTREFWETAGFSFEDGWIWEDGKMPYFIGDMAFDWPKWLALDSDIAPAVLTKAPKAKAGLEYTGSSQELVEPGVAEGGALLYSLSENGEYSEEIPTGINAGIYTVWYKVAGDDSHTSLPQASLTATVAKAVQPDAIPEDISVPAGSVLSSIALPDGWSWKEPSQVLVTGKNQVAVVYADTANYEQTEFTITVTMTEPVHVHSLTQTEAKAATCTAEGNLEYWTCSDCKGVFADAGGTVPTTPEERATAKLPHDYQEVVTAPTCTTGGYTTHTCSKCRQSYTDDEKDPLGHDLGKWTQTKAPNCTEKGVEESSCSRGDYSETRDIAAKGHTSPGEWDVVTQATTEQEGLRVKKCTVCQVELERESIPKLTPTPPDLPDPPLPPSPPTVDPTPPMIDPEPVKWQNLFVDVKQGDWFYDSVEYVCENGLFYGTSETTFSPTVDMTRGMLATVLYRLAKEPGAAVSSIFSDVADGKYYTEAIAWADKNKIVAGYGNGKFGPEDFITREQLATILWRYAGSPKSIGKLDSFTDRDKVADYAVSALQWAVEQKIVSGKGNGILDPRGKATRAEVAAMLMRYCAKAK